MTVVWRQRLADRLAAEDAIQTEFGLAAFEGDAKRCLAAVEDAIRARKHYAKDLRRRHLPTHVVDAELRMLQGGASTLGYHVRGITYIGYCSGWPAKGFR